MKRLPLVLRQLLFSLYPVHPCLLVECELSYRGTLAAGVGAKTGTKPQWASSESTVKQEVALTLEKSQERLRMQLLWRSGCCKQRYQRDRTGPGEKQASA